MCVMNKQQDGHIQKRLGFPVTGRLRVVSEGEKDMELDFQR